MVMARENEKKCKRYGDDINIYYIILLYYILYIIIIIILYYILYILIITKMKSLAVDPDVKGWDTSVTGSSN